MGVAIKFLLILTLACLAVSIVVLVFWNVWKYIVNNYLTDAARIERAVEEYNSIIEKGN